MSGALKTIVWYTPNLKILSPDWASWLTSGTLLRLFLMEPKRRGTFTTTTLRKRADFQVCDQAELHGLKDGLLNGRRGCLNSVVADTEPFAIRVPDIQGLPQAVKTRNVVVEPMYTPPVDVCPGRGNPYQEPLMYRMRSPSSRSEDDRLPENEWKHKGCYGCGTYTDGGICGASAAHFEARTRGFEDRH